MTILIIPPPTSFLYLTSAMSGSTPVVSQSIMNAIVPVGASTEIWLLRMPFRSPSSTTPSQDFLAAFNSSSGTCAGSTSFSAARWLHMTCSIGWRFAS